MPTKWNRGVRETGKLKVYNKAGGWSAAVDGAIGSFNNLGLGVQLIKESDETAANVVVVLANGADTYPRGSYVLTAEKFTADILHGMAKTRATSARRGRDVEIDFAVVFLPGRVPNATPKQKEVIVVHELIHASGLNGGLPNGSDAPNKDHDSEGIMYPQMQIAGDGLIEQLHDKGASPMTPIRVGVKTRCTLRMLWTNEGCEHN
ncbi:MAG TPA: hypothetical protein VGC97_24240 [Pyrinomonadaceae bacterium]|jgi:hypothetical protein